ncbi:hypothetical protein KUTeg_022951 [Tegillarca granosa]|uniref:RING-type domain-containing protein n=1 Tax=Tegillarca granosa TaxID=220873 RepID=A0ABQ9E3B5_TEGGR|nr:hypothetical protein KUTeg_022951 [Tegillarca granosa]
MTERVNQMMDLDKSLFCRVQNKLSCQQDSEKEDAGNAALKTNMDVEMNSCSLHQDESETSPRQQHENSRDANGSFILIPDTPSPVFSRFVGKSSLCQRSKNVNTNTKDQGDDVQNGYQKKYGLPVSSTNQDHETTASDRRWSVFPQKMHKSNMHNQRFFQDPSCTMSKGSIYDASNKIKPDGTFTLCSKPIKSFTDTSSLVQINLATANQNQIMAPSTLNVNGPITDDVAREIALEKIKAVRNRRASQKRYFQDVINCEDDMKSCKQAKKRNESDSYSKFSNETFGSGVAHVVEKSNIDLRSDDGNDYRQSESQSSRLSENMCNSNCEEGNGISREQDKLAPHLDSRQDKTEAVSRQSALDKLKKKRERKKVNLLGNRTSTACKDSSKKDSAEAIPRKFTPLCWPSESESESDSDCSDCIPLREILSSNKSDKKKIEEKSKCGTMVKKHSVNKKQGDSFSNQGGACGQDNNGGDSQKTSNRVKVLRSSSVISISSDDSMDQLYDDCISNSQLEQIMSDDFIPPLSPGAVSNATYTVNRSPSIDDYLNFRSVRNNIDDLDLPSVDHSSNCCYDSHLTSSEPSNQLLLQSSQVSSTGGLVNPTRNRVRTSGPNIPKRSRSSTNSVKGGAVGFRPASSLIRRHSRGEVDPVTVIQQLENDEEYARKLQDSAEAIPRKFTPLCWPSESESESDSDCSDCIPLREILSSNKSDKKKIEEKSKCGTMVKKHSVNKKQGDSFSNHLALIEGGACGQDNNGGDSQKTSNRVKVLRSSSVISISSDDSMDQLYDDCISNSQLEQIMSDDFIPPLSPGAVSNATYTVNRSPSIDDYLNFRSVRHNIDDLDLPSVDHSSNCCYDSHLTSSEPSNQLLLQSSQVSSTGGLVNPTRNRVRTSGPNIPKRSRSSTNSVKGGAVGFRPASSLIRRHSRGEVDPVTVIQQLENDEEYARKLQEEMDLEFAMSLHNMENTPPQPYTGEPHDHFADTLDNHHNHLIQQQSRHTAVQRGRHYPRRSDNISIDELEALLDTTDDSLPFVQMPVVTSPPRLRSRSQRSRSQRSQNNMGQLGNRDTYITSLINASAAYDLWNIADMLGDVKEKGISQAEASRLPQRKFQTRNDADDLEECMICMCEYVTGDDLRILPCFHEYHAPCIDKWLNRFILGIFQCMNDLCKVHKTRIVNICTCIKSMKRYIEIAKVSCHGKVFGFSLPKKKEKKMHF